jgi:hypothetical protein
MRNKNSPTPRLSASEINNILNGAWTDAARLNPLLLAKLRLDYDFSRLREMVQDCLGQGLSTLQARQRVKDALLRDSISHEQAASRCDDNALQGQTRESSR